VIAAAVTGLLALFTPQSKVFKVVATSALPVVAFPDECWYCGHCESVCPTNAITIVFPDEILHNSSDVLALLGRVDPAGDAATEG